jgi:hypothetical protein
MGLNHMGKMTRAYANAMLQEIGHPDFGFGSDPSAAYGSAYNESQRNREGHSIAAGLSLGLILLGKGNVLSERSDGKFVDELTKYIHYGLPSNTKSVPSSLLVDSAAPYVIHYFYSCIQVICFLLVVRQ